MLQKTNPSAGAPHVGRHPRKYGELGSVDHERLQSSPRSWARDRWFREGATPYPHKNDDMADIRAVFDRLIPHGLAPATPPFERDAEILTLGSCFAQELRRFLTYCGVSSGNFWIPSGLNNTFALASFLEWCLDGRTGDEAYWYEQAAGGGAYRWEATEEQAEYRHHFLEAQGILLTLGLAEVWSDQTTGKVFWRGVPQGVFDEGRHVFRVSGVDENEANLVRIIETIRRHCGPIPIILMLSPVPLAATFRPVSCVAADCVSKSILRVAIDQVLRRNLDGVHYWPSFEMVKWAGAHFDFAVFGADDGWSRHVSRFVVVNVIKSFVEHYFDAKTAEALIGKLVRACGDPEIFARARPVPLVGELFPPMPGGTTENWRERQYEFLRVPDED